MIMPDFYDFCCRVRTVSGNKALEEIPGLLAGMNSRRPLIITDKGVEAVGLINVLKKALGKKLSIGAVFDKVPVDSDYKIVDEAAALYRSKKCDSIIAVGGGSVIDTAKGVNIVASLGGKSLLQYQGAGTVRQKLNPMAIIPTTAGTGSEMTLVAVIADTDRHIKMLFVSYFLLPDLAILDPRMTATLPDFLTAATAMDAMTHACEAYYCMEKNPMSDSFALGAIELISRNLLRVMKNPGDMDGRLALASASTMAGGAFSNSMVGLVHNLGHTIGALCHVPHGNCMSILLPYGFEYNLHRRAAIIGELLFPLAGPEVYAKTPKKDRPEKVIEHIRQMNQDLHDVTGGRHPRFLKEIKNRQGDPMVPRSMLPDIAAAMMMDGARMHNPEEILPDDALMVLEHAWEGTPLDRKKVKKG
ncbi:MAG: alcohol dehydrogenase [Spirochaetae bacterium HGW-Spirochaetae-1]|jgi:alcohol dehydrogenase|nr:MAG: alcohol dehydrogenase [Spirochaetae bacterium HGW-Spirochaetae-1]